MADRISGTAVVTGATSGIGYVTALELARAGARVIAMGRSPEKIATQDAEIRRQVPDTDIEWLCADFGSLAEVTAACESIAGMTDRIDVLVNNAGNQLDRQLKTADGFEMTYQVNHLVPFLMTRRLLPIVLESARPQVITLSSIGHTMIDDMVWDDLQIEQGFDPFRAYCQSKLANVLFTRELARRNAGTRLVASAVHPGMVASDFPRKGGQYMQDYYSAAFARGEALTSEQGADTVIWLALDAERGHPSGGYFYQRERIDPSAAGADPKSATRLWEISEEQLGGSS